MCKVKANTICIIVFTILFAYANTTGVFDHDTELGLLNFMARSNGILQQDPSRSLNCFNKYIPLINAIANNYETNFKTCLNESEAANAKADEATLEQRNGLVNAAEASCALLRQCPEEDTVEKIFQCYIHGGSANVQTMYTINANASQELAVLREQYYLIRNKEYKCTNDTKRAYERESAAAYAGLNNCILGKEEEEPSSTTVTTTNAPNTTTEVTTAVTPETSNNPIRTTTTIPQTTGTTPAETTSINPEIQTTEPEETENTTIPEPESSEDDNFEDPDEYYD